MPTSTPQDFARSFTIAFTMRSGSNALCDLLRQNGVGKPTEIFQYPYQSNYFFSAHRELPPSEAIARVVADNTVNGIFGSKMTHDQRARFDESVSSKRGRPRTVGDVLPTHKWIWLRRRDRIAQALSLFVADATNIWVGSGNSAPQDVEYDFYAILARCMTLDAGELAWDSYWRSHGIRPYVLYYEEVFADVERSLNSIAAYLGVRDRLPKPLVLTSNVRLQRDEVTQKLTAQFVQDLCAIGSTAIEKRMGVSRKKWDAFFTERQWRP